MPLLTGEDFFDLFRTFEHAAYRLEVRDSYYEKDQLGQYLAGTQVDLRYMEAWLGLIVQLRVQGKRVERVRVVSRPLSDYSRYGLWLCQYNTAAGEDIRYLDRRAADGLPGYDYWLFDSSRLYIVRFDESNDDLLGAEHIDDVAAIVNHNRWRDTAWHHATPYGEFMKATGVAAEHPPGA